MMSLYKFLNRIFIDKILYIKINQQVNIRKRASRHICRPAPFYIVRGRKAYSVVVVTVPTMDTGLTMVSEGVIFVKVETSFQALDEPAGVPR